MGLNVGCLTFKTTSASKASWAETILAPEAIYLASVIEAPYPAPVSTKNWTPFFLTILSTVSGVMETLFSLGNTSLGTPIRRVLASVAKNLGTGAVTLQERILRNNIRFIVTLDRILYLNILKDLNLSNFINFIGKCTKNLKFKIDKKPFCLSWKSWKMSPSSNIEYLI